MRHTKARSQILSIFKSSRRPLSASDLLEKMDVNKTTIYREFDFLVEEGILSPIEFGDGKKRYELADMDHHHHLVCLSCKSVAEIKMRENFSIPADFKVVKHNLEFFGYCSECK
jgi:Fur family ferric uptake transcriptional regulator